MSMRVFAFNANPQVDPFLYKQSKQRAENLVQANEADFFILPDGRRAVRLRRHGAPDQRGMTSSMNDWITQQVSDLPQECWESLGHQVRITTRQLVT